MTDATEDDWERESGARRLLYWEVGAPVRELPVYRRALELSIEIAAEIGRAHQTGYSAGSIVGHLEELERAQLACVQLEKALEEWSQHLRRKYVTTCR